MAEKEQDLILADLNEEQKKAVTYGQSSLLIVAGAGTGKTTVITRRLGWLILSGKAKPEEILALTFTEKAAEEMEERVDRLLPYGYLDLWISTFHAFCQRVLKDEAVNIGLSGDFKLLSEPEQWALLRKNLNRLELDYYKPLGNPTKFIRALVQHFSRAKDEAVTPEEYLKYTEEIKLNSDSVMSDGLVSSESTRLAEIAHAYQVYQDLLLEDNSLDFGDLINYTLKLFRERPLILEKYRKQFKYILVDEFQDTNWAQYELLKILAEPKNNLTVVFDDDQALYTWRGASYNNAIQIAKDYPEASKIILTENYRNKQNIIDLAYQFIQLNNPNRLEYQLNPSPLAKGEGLNQKKGKDLAGLKELKFEKGFSKKLEAERKGEAEILHMHQGDHHEEKKAVIEKIIELKKEPDTNWNDFAILARTNSQANAFADALTQAGIPCQFLASSGLYTKPIILDILAWLELLDDYHESPALWRILNLDSFGIPEEDVVNLTHYSRRKSLSLYQTIKKAHSLENISKRGLEAIDKILGLIEAHSRLAKQSVLRTVYAFLKDSGYFNILKETSQENLENIDLINQFLKRVEAFEEANTDKSVKNFTTLMKVSLEAGDTGRLEPTLEGPEAVKVLTVHGAKGLEFRHVFVVGLVDRYFPTTERRDPIELPDGLIKEIIPEGDIHLEEERRLFYVAMTRARDGLYFTSAEDYGGLRRKKLSRFLVELGYSRPAEKGEVGGRSDLLKIPKISSKSGLHPDRLERLELPKKFSFTQLKEFETCPLQYKYKHVLHIPVKGRGSFSFGRTMHDTLYKFFVRLREASCQGSLFSGDIATMRGGTLPPLGEKDLLNFYQECWIDDWYEDREHLEAYKEKGEEILKKFFKKLSAAQLPQVKYLEQAFNFRIDPYTIKGKIDRIDQVPGGLEIIDYKTGQSKEYKELTLDNKEQLLIYQMAVEEVLKERPVRLTFYWLEDNSSCSFLGADEEIEKLKEKILAEIEEIKKSKFPPTPSSHKCKFCDYREICEHRAS